MKNQITETADTEKQWKGISRAGGIAAVIAIFGILLDVAAGIMTGGNLPDLPGTAIGRFAELHAGRVLGLYNLDLLNVINQIILIPAYFALTASHRGVNLAWSSLAFIIFLTGTIILATGNSALAMMELCGKYFSAADDAQKTLYAAAGEALLAKGAHGSPGAFIGFLLPNLAGVIMSVVMLKGKVFGRINSWLGIIGSILLSLYIVLVTFVPAVKGSATAAAMPGGLMALAWMVMFALRLFRLGSMNHV